MAEKKPRRTWISVPCTAYTIMQNLRKKTKKSRRKLKRQRLEARRIVLQSLRGGRACVRAGGDVYFEWPRRCTGWRLRLLRNFQAWLRKKGKTVHFVKIDACMYGLKNPATGNMLQKGFTIMTTDGGLVSASRVCSKEHRFKFKHEPIQGQALTASTAFYPQDMVDRILSLWSMNDI